MKNPPKAVISMTFSLNCSLLNNDSLSTDFYKFLNEKFYLTFKQNEYILPLRFRNELCILLKQLSYAHEKFKTKKYKSVHGDVIKVEDYVRSHIIEDTR